jgi:hypothetical protein
MFLPTIHIDNTLCDALHTGRVVLRPGQWVKLAWSDRRARYIGCTRRGILVVQHYEDGYDPQTFHLLVDYWRGQR